ncbi:MAG: hypothetical protein KFH87_07790 [Bacteroidetes bacterium]|nr:hypothetical protein [Bacteroidota bacterium]
MYFPNFIAEIIPFLLLIQDAGQDDIRRQVLAIAFYAAYTVAIPLLPGLIGLRWLDKPYRFFVYLLAFTFLTELAGMLLSRMEIPNLWLYNTYTAIEYTLLMLIFSMINQNERIRRLLLFSIPVFLVIWIFSTFILKSSDQFQGIFLSIVSVVFVIISVATLINEMRNSEVLLVDNPVFWFSSGVLIYFAGNVIVFALIDQLLGESEAALYSGWLIHAAMNVTKNLLFTIAIISTGAPKRVIGDLYNGIRIQQKNR